ncbi:MAG: hypothetical protein ACKPKO_44470, partial [Candidatus Fonsibacter sp.]
MRGVQFFWYLWVLASCNIAQERDKESITSGRLKLGSDLSYSILADAQTFAYTHLNPYAEIETQFLPESELFQLLLKD